MLDLFEVGYFINVIPIFCLHGQCKSSFQLHHWTEQILVLALTSTQDDDHHLEFLKSGHFYLMNRVFRVDVKKVITNSIAFDSIDKPAN